MGNAPSHTAPSRAHVGTGVRKSYAAVKQRLNELKELACIRGGGADDDQVARLEKKLEDAMHARSTATRSHRRFRSLEQIMLKLGAVEKGTARAHSLFKSLDTDGSGTISLEELAASRALFSSDDLELIAIFQESDINHDDQLTYLEFLLTLGIVHLLQNQGKGDGGNEDDQGDSAAMAAAFDIIIDAFIFFDKDGSGTISEAEVRLAFDSGLDAGARSVPKTAPGERAGDADHDGAHERFSEMQHHGDADVGGEGGSDVRRDSGTAVVSFADFFLQCLEWASVSMEEQEAKV